MPEPERVLALLHELEAADAEKGALLDEVDRLAREVEAVQMAASRLQDFEARLPAVRKTTTENLKRAHFQVSRAYVGVGEAENAVRRASKDGARDAELFEVRARDSLLVAKRRYADARTACRELDADAEAAEGEVRAVRVKARGLAKELAARPRLAKPAGTKPGRGLAEITGWGEVARAALLVTRGQLAAERDAVIRQANELGSAALGESLGSASVFVVARRIEQALPR